MRRLNTVMAAVFIVGQTAAALAAPPDANAPQPGRYTMQPTEGGFLRLDTATGDMSLCKPAQGTFECRPVKDDRDLQVEIERLVKENKELKAEIKRLDDMLGLNGDKAGKPAKPGIGPKIELPTEQDVDKAFSYLERMIKKFRDKMKDLEGQGSGEKGKGTPL
ncbi:MAG: hypothetical protein R3D67_00955 [Hyphomicrobiaceae bacterium]